MRPKVNTWINWSAKELEDLVNQKNSCVFKETIRKHIPMYSVHLSDVRKSFKDILNSSINTFDSSFDGLLISYQNPTILCPLTQMFYDVQFVHVDLQADFYIFRPTVDSILTGIANKKETNYIGVLMHKTFNVSITKRSNDECWLGHNVVVGDKVTFRVTLVDLKAKVPFIRGELLSSETTENDEQMDFAEEEIHEEGGTERDSGYQESENETKPLKSKITNGFLVGAGSDFENEEYTRKAKKKKIKSPEKIQSPIKMAKKRKHDYDNDDVSPKKETQTKVKRLKVDDQLKKEEEQKNMEKELSASPSHSVIGSDKPRIIHDEVWPNRSVNIKLENNVEKKTKKKKVSHDISDSDEDQSSQSSSIIHQEKKEEKNDDDVPHDHSQSFGLKESPITTSDDEQNALKVEESINEFSQKKLENKNEKKSKKKKAQNVTNSQEDQFQSQSPSFKTDSQGEKDDDDDDGDIPHDHSQYFGRTESPASNSDDEPETPKVQESVIKSPKKKRENNDEKKKVPKIKKSIDKSPQKELKEKKKKKKKTSGTNSVTESELSILNNTEVTVDTSIVKQESKKKKKKKSIDSIANLLSNSTINDSQFDSFTELDDSTLNSRELQMTVIKIKEEHKGKKSKVADFSGNTTINESELDSVVDDSSTLQGLGNSSEVKTKKSKTKEFIEPQVPQTESDSGAKKSKSKKSNFVTDLKIKEEPASDAEGSHKKSKSKHKEADKSNNVSKKITIKQEVIIKQEDKKSGKRKNKDDTINLSDVKFEAASDTEGPAAKKKIHKLVFTE
ncbi:hypothetical protein G9C98_006595 [Cotesia typhae]|uniref:DNA-directed RNA polymerase I subunit RPA43 n=1 Tax=Cotesia typhae TaxID=2053667 RepID=A0A8J5VA65_9HYME|nr:hypothetical protein G9C98_006595 [Cotesia typhae]